MTAWDQCSVCGKATTSGYVVCNACASRIIERQKAAAVPLVRVVIDGQGGHVPRDPNDRGKVICSSCARWMDWTKDKWTCPHCGYTEGLE